eukprot:GAFH01004871.1.p1 GENE.GAFH01004871.1~~GAFH01004871.1.p1  ORF type:complete len:184 (+),score=64.74 GAFH01004871.1:51-602(+)
MQVSQAVETRHTVRKYQTTPVPRHLIEQLLNAALMAPSARNQQPWKFYVLSDAQKIAQLGTAIEKLAINPNLAQRKENLHVENVIFYDAPTVLFVTRPKEASVFAELDCGLAVQNLLLTAHSLGLGTCPVGLARMYGKELVPQYVPLRADEEFVLAITVGYPVPAGVNPAHPIDTAAHVQWIE